MRHYEKPSVIVNGDYAENVYTASGDGGDCYTVRTNIHQAPETGRGDFRIQVDGLHDAGNGHHSGEQVLTLNFNQAVEYVASNGELVGGNNTASIQIKYNYHNNAQDNIGLGDVIVTAEAGLAVNGAILDCNYDCGQH